MDKRCEACQGVNRPAALYCSKCGAKLPFVSSGDASQAAQEEARSLVTHLIDTLRDQVLWLGSIGSLGHPLLFLRAGSEQQSQTKDGYSQDEEVGNKERLWVAATAAFSKLDTKTKVLFFEWLLPVLRLDHAVDSQSLVKVFCCSLALACPLPSVNDSLCRCFSPRSCLNRLARWRWEGIFRSSGCSSMR